MIWFADVQNERDFTDLIKGIILGLFEMYALCICVCICTVYLYFLLALKKRGTVQLQILAPLGWMQPSCQDEVQPVVNHLYYMNWWGRHHCQRPIFILRRLLSKVSLAIDVGLCMISEYCMLVVNIFLKKGVLLRPSVKFGKHLQIHLLRSVTVPSSQKQFRLEGASGDLWSSLLLKIISSLSQTTLLRAERALLVQSPNCVFFSPSYIFLTEKCNSAIPYKSNYFPASSLPSLLSAFHEKKGKKRGRMPKSLSLMSSSKTINF